MMLGIGTALPVGIVGGLFHMINHAMYKSCLFLTGGCGGEAGRHDGPRRARRPRPRRCRVTFVCFIVAAASISGVPPFNGFFSKELVYDAALGARHRSSTSPRCSGSFFTAASFLKLGHAAFLGKRARATRTVQEAPLAHARADDRHRGALRALRRRATRCRSTSLIVPVDRAAAARRRSPWADCPMQTLLVVLTVAGAGRRAGQPPARRAHARAAGSGPRTTSTTRPASPRSTTGPSRGWLDPYDPGPLRDRAPWSRSLLGDRPRHRLALRRCLAAGGGAVARQRSRPAAGREAIPSTSCVARWRGCGGR